METISWDSSFSVGVARLDEQHKRIIGMINLMISAPDNTVKSETISETLTRMTQYAEEHFVTEEQLMEDHGYPDFLAHRDEHREFWKKTETLCMDTMQEHTDLPVDILEFLRGWWNQHILTTDMKYRTFFNERGVK